VLAAPELSIHAIMKPVIAHHKRALTVLLEATSLELAKSVVARGLGVTFQTRIGLEREIAERRLAYVPLKSQARIATELGVYVRAGRTLPAVLDAFIRTVAEELERRGAEEVEV
jgi:DNA-binding transcriptional LysR family regulator